MKAARDALWVVLLGLLASGSSPPAAEASPSSDLPVKPGGPAAANPQEPGPGSPETRKDGHLCARVLAVEAYCRCERGPRLLVINAGKKHGVKEGLKFRIFDGDDCVGKSLPVGQAPDHVHDGLKADTAKIGDSTCKVVVETWQAESGPRPRARLQPGCQAIARIRAEEPPRPVPGPIRARVVKVSEVEKPGTRARTAVIGAGEKQGVKPGMCFSFFVDGEFLCRSLAVTRASHDGAGKFEDDESLCAVTIEPSRENAGLRRLVAGAEAVSEIVLSRANDLKGDITDVSEWKEGAPHVAAKVNLGTDQGAKQGYAVQFQRTGKDGNDRYVVAHGVVLQVERESCVVAVGTDLAAGDEAVCAEVDPRNPKRGPRWKAMVTKVRAAGTEIVLTIAAGKKKGVKGNDPVHFHRGGEVQPLAPIGMVLEAGEASSTVGVALVLAGDKALVRKTTE